VDGLMDEGWQVHLANPAAIQQYRGLKFTGDRHDAFWLARMLQMGILPEGFIYPKNKRPIRDLLRARGILVRKRTSLVTSLSNIIVRNTGRKLCAGSIGAIRTNHVHPLLAYNENLLAAADAFKVTIDALTERIAELEALVMTQAKPEPFYEQLLSIPGVGKILGLTITLETGPIDRFASAGQYASYCRKVPSKRVSNDKIKGRGNAKNGNRYLAWAFGMAAEHARRHDERARAFYNRKLRKTNAAVAHAALGNKLARAAYHMMTTGQRFVPERVFG